MVKARVLSKLVLQKLKTLQEGQWIKKITVAHSPLWILSETQSLFLKPSLAQLYARRIFQLPEKYFPSDLKKYLTKIIAKYSDHSKKQQQKTSHLLGCTSRWVPLAKFSSHSQHALSKNCLTFPLWQP